MNEKNLFRTVLMVPFCCCMLTSFSQLKRSGIANLRSTFLSGNEGGAPIPGKHHHKIWFKDSTVVYELRINLESDESTLEGRVIKKSQPVWMYSFIDLRTMTGQDYLHFKDSAVPFSNYQLKENEFPGWQFYNAAPRSKPDLIDKNLPDTTINGEKVKRVKVLNQHYPLIKEYVIYYLRRDPSKHMFHMDHEIYEIYPGFRAYQIDHFDDKDNLWSRSELSMAPNDLSREEKLVLTQWERNAKTTRLPLLSSRLEALSSNAIPQPPHENPTIQLVPHSRGN